MSNTGTNYKEKYPNYLVCDEDLLYRLADAKLLHKLARVAPNKYQEGKRIWYFDKDEDVWTIIKEYLIEKKNAEHSKEN